MPFTTKLSDEKINEIRRLRTQGVLAKVIAYQMNVGIKTVWKYSNDLRDGVLHKDETQMETRP